jgi:hypothetical protein
MGFETNPVSFLADFVCGVAAPLKLLLININR